jgi:hypothetical protein
MREVLQEFWISGRYLTVTFLMPAHSGQYGLGVDCRPFNRKLACDSVTMPSLEHSFYNIMDAKYFSVLGLNTVYCQIPLSAGSRRITAFCSPFGLGECTKLPVVISVGCQVLCTVVHLLLAELKHHHVSTLWTIWWYTLGPLKNISSV